MKTNLLSTQNKGYLTALLATMAFANVYIFSKAALNEITLPQFGVYWFAIGFLFNLLFGISQQSLKPLRKIKWTDAKSLVFLWLLEIITTVSFFISIQLIEDPAVTSLIGNMFVVFLVILGVLLLKERFTKLESIGVFITIFGAFAVGYKGGNSLKDFFIPGTGVVVINCFMAAYTSIVAKKAIQKFSPSLVNINRTFILFLFSVIYMTFSGESWNIPLSAAKHIFIGASLGPVLAMLAVYYSYKYIEASRSSVIQGLKGIFVLIGAYIYFGTFPQTLQLVGGLVSILGVLIMTMSKAKIISLKKEPKTEFKKP